MSLNRKTQLLLKKISKRIPLLFWFALFLAVFWSWDNKDLEYISKPVKESFYKFSGKMGFVLKDVYISGNNHITSETILQILGAIQEKPIFSLSLTDARERLKSIGWIEKVKIERQLPSTLHVMIIERKPYALWQYRGNINLIDSAGEIILKENSGGYNDLPIIVGEDANLHAKNLFSFLSSDDDVFNHVSSVIRVGGRRWNVRLDNGVEVRLPEEKAENAWKDLINLQKNKKLLDRKIKYVDLRVPGKLFIEPRKK